MANMKRWISEVQYESQELIEKIICSQSDSSDEQECDKIRSNKKVKLAFPTSNIFESNVLSSIEEYSPRKNENNQNTEENGSEIHQNTSLQRTISSPKNEYEIEFNSPILKQKSNIQIFNSEHKSPILNSTYSDESLSPVLTNMEKLKRIQEKTKNMKNISKIQNEQPSPDLFHSQATQIIEQNFSPDHITQSSSEKLDTLEQIEIISSQDCSSITVINPSSSGGSSSVTDVAQYYHQPNHKKKCYKKGGLLHQLKTVMDLQTSRISLWHHDIFVKNIIPSNLEHIICLVKTTWKDFGCLILECCKTNQETDLFLVCLGNTMNYNTLCNFKQIIKVFPPYKIKIVHFKNKEVNLYYNISKVLTDNDGSNV